MAWIGLVKESTRMVEPVTSYGAGTEYLQGIEISINTDHPSGRGTTGTAIRENRPVYIQDFKSDPRLAPWHERARRYGWEGVAALPLHSDGQTIGALMLYATDTNAFDEAECNLLQGMAADIDLALEKFLLDNRRKQAEDALRESEARTRLILDTAMDAVININEAGNVIAWNNEAERMFGYSVEYALGKDLSELIIPPVHREAHRKGMKRFLASEKSTIIGKRIEITGIHQDGTEIPVELSLAAILRNGQYFFNAFIRDLTEQRKVEENLRVTAVTFDSQESIMITDSTGDILRINRAFEEMSGYKAIEVIGKNPHIFQSGRHNTEFYRTMWTKLDETGKWTGEIWDKRKNGEIYPTLTTITAVHDKSKKISHYVAVSHDISQRKKSEQDIHQLAFYDPLTGLPNRRLLQDRLQQAVAASARNGCHGALIFLDLDNFKTINDTQGHAVGDLLLKEATGRLQFCIREGDSVARLGGDEFVIVLEGLSSVTNEAITQAESIAEKIQHELRKTYVLENLECISSASIGINLFKGHDESLDNLLKYADTAMYQAKAAGRNAIRFYDPAMQSALEARIKLENELRKAINKNQLVTHYQVQVDHQQNVLGAEVLIRWQHPARGLIPPLEFISLAEETGLIVPIGLWVLRTACRQIKEWQKNELARHLKLSVNVSAKQFRQPDFVHQVQQVLQEFDIHPSLLKLELTESTVLENIDDTICKMNLLKKSGVSFSMDDFGTGYSSLQYLKRLPLDEIKIDQSFVRDIARDPNDAAIVKTIIAMTIALGLDVIAEGVETPAQRNFLDKHGCHTFQGYLFSKPVPISQFEKWLHHDL